MNWIEVILSLLTGGGLGGALSWLFGRRVQKAQSDKEEFVNYRDIFLELKGTIKQLQNEINDLQEELGRFRRAINKSFSCRYFNNCPVQHELLHDKADRGKQQKNRQPRHVRAGEVVGDGGASVGKNGVADTCERVAEIGAEGGVR